MFTMLPLPFALRWGSAALQPYHAALDRKSTRLNSSHLVISYAVFCLKKKNRTTCLSKGWNEEVKYARARPRRTFCFSPWHAACTYLPPDYVRRVHARLAVSSLHTVPA